MSEVAHIEAPQLPDRSLVIERFSDKTRHEGDCVLWTGATVRAGYGQLTICGKRYTAHRLAAAVLGGMDIEGGMVCHHCDNPACVNPDHLYVGNAATNRRDALSRGRWRHPWADNSHCKRGHKYADGSFRIAADGSRVCRACMRDHMRRWRAAQ